LESFAIEGIQVGSLVTHVLELTCCDWAMQSKCLRSVTMSNCGIDGALFLKQFLEFDIGLKELTLIGNDFTKAIPKLQQVAVKELNFLCLQSPKTITLDFLSSLLEVIETHSIILKGLDLSDLNLPTEELTEFVKQLASNSMSDLNMIIFDNNRMNLIQTNYFLRLLERQSGLTTLSLNYAIDISSSPTGLITFLSIIKNFHLHSLSLRSDGSMPFSFGQLLLPLFTSEFLLSIEYLDITNQSVNEKCLEMILQHLDRGSLTDLLFDGSSVQSFDFLCRICEKLLSSRLHFVSFPSQDFDKILRLLPSTQDAVPLIAKRDELAERFATVYRDCVDLFERIRQITTAAVARMPSDPRIAEIVTLTPSLSRSDSDLFLPKSFQEARRMSPQQLELFEECLDPEESVELDPILRIMKDIHDRLSLDALIAEAS
jgi:hypothetical protein